MKFSVYAVVLSLLALFYCLAFVLMPVKFASQYGLHLDAGGEVLGRFFGAALGGHGIILWLIRSKSPNDIAARAVLWSAIFYNAVFLIVTLNSIFDKLANSLAWTTVFLDILIILASLYFLAFKKQFN
jgi:hypothetical protein